MFGWKLARISTTNRIFLTAWGAIDEKHVVLQCPADTGSSCFCYKGTFTIIVLAAVDANYLFKYAHVGMQGTTCDGVFLHSAFYNVLNSAVLNVPQRSVLPGKDKLVPYVLVADDAFSLTSYLINHKLERCPQGAQIECLITDCHEHVVKSEMHLDSWPPYSEHFASHSSSNLLQLKSLH